MGDVAVLRATLRLTLSAGVGSITFGRLVQAFGHVCDVPADNPPLLRRVDGIGEKTAGAIAAVTDADVDAELELADRMGVGVLAADDEDYPASLRNIYDPPAVLYIRGRLSPADALAVGVVGARHCTHYGMEQAERFGQLLGRAGFSVVSGGARGIDTAAHRGALAVGARTVAVMGCGLAKLYPPENQELFDRIVGEDRGAIVSELPLRTAVLPGNFPTRNRIISGMSLGVLVVEAARRSGSLITARVAAEQGRTVFAVPGRVDSPTSQGTNELIRNGAVLVQDLDDVLEHLGDVGTKMKPSDAELLPPAPTAGSPAEQKLMDALAGGQLNLDELVRATGIDSGKALSAMTMLVLKGAVAQQAGNVFTLKRT